MRALLRVSSRCGVPARPETGSNGIATGLTEATRDRKTSRVPSFENRGSPTAALASYQPALAAYQRAGLLRGLAETHHNIGISQRHLGDFARALGDYLGARVAGHTFVIGYFQSGLHSLAPGMAPSWSPAEGLSRGTPAAPEAAFGSGPRLPNTVTCFDSKVPEGF